MNTNHSVPNRTLEGKSLRRMSRRFSQLNEAQLEFINSEACRYVSPYSLVFWKNMTEWLTALSAEAAAYPKASDYRGALEPYLLQRVHMLARTWNIREVTDDGKIRLLLKDVRLTHVRSEGIGATPNVVVDHMNIWVSTAWFIHVQPDCVEPLALDGILCEYVNAARQTRNIGIMPVLVMPRNRKIRGARQGGCAPCTHEIVE